MEEQLEAREARIINPMDVIQHNASFKKAIESEIAVPSCPLPTPSGPETVDFPYGRPMNVTKGQVGSSAACCAVLLIDLIRAVAALVSRVRQQQRRCGIDEL